MDMRSTHHSHITGTARRKLRAVSIQGKHIRNIALAVCSFFFAPLPVFADEREEEITRLKEEVAQLRAECQALRTMLAEPAEAPAKPATNRVVVVVEEKTPETALLRAECQALRLLLATPAILVQPNNGPDKNETPAEPASPRADTTLNAEPAFPADAWVIALPSGFTHWLTTSSGVRHNSKCPNFHKTVGRPCKAGDGRPCGRCGG